MDQDLQIDFELLEKIEVTLSSIAFLSFLTNIIGRLIQIKKTNMEVWGNRLLCKYNRGGSGLELVSDRSPTVKLSKDEYSC